MRSVASHRVETFTGKLTVPGDKSISHRALISGASAVGETKILGLLDSGDIKATANALRFLGADIAKNNDGSWSVVGRGVGGLSESPSILDMGNSGTGARLLMGLVAAHPFNTMFSGDVSLSTRPMDRVMGPLRRMGADFTARNNERLPLVVHGSDMLRPVKETLLVASAQVKSAILLAGLNTRGNTTVVELSPTRDHTENILMAFGAKISIEASQQEKAITLTGQPEFLARKITIPGDTSSAAFPLVAALIIPGARVKIENIGLNPMRTGFLDTLIEMGAQIKIDNKRTVTGEPIGDVSAKFGPLHGVRVPRERAPSMIDEYPIVAVAAACADGETIFEGVSELRLKESDRVAAIAAGLTASRVEVRETEDSLVIIGTGNPPMGGVQIAANLDHRIAMAFLVLGMITAKSIVVDDVSCIDTSFPGFMELMNELGGDLKTATQP